MCHWLRDITLSSNEFTLMVHLTVFLMGLVNEMLNIFLCEVLCGIVSKPFEKKVLQNVHNFNSAFLYIKEVLEKK